MAIFPQNGRVVIVDNDIKEAEPLMKTLSKNNIKFSYFSGDTDQLPKPEENLCDVRFLFLDLQLIKSEENPKSIASSLHGLIKNLISEKNCPYIIIVWSKQEKKFFDAFLSVFSDDPTLKKPIDFIDLEKSDYFSFIKGEWTPNADEETILNSIEGKIFEKLSSNDPFHLFTYWDNLVHKSSNEIIHSFSSFIGTTEKPDKKMWSIFRALAQANSGINLKLDDGNDVIQNALITFNGILLDSEKNIKLSEYTNETPNFSKINMEEDDFSPKINTRLLLDETGEKFSPGNVYNSDRCDFKKKILDNCIDLNKLQDEFTEYFAVKNFITNKGAKIELFKETGKLKSKYYHDLQKFHECCIENYMILQSNLIYCEVSPVCDFSNQKLELHRIVYGLKIQGKHASFIRTALYIYESPLFRDENGYYKFIFDLRFFGSVESNEIIEKRPLLRFRHELLVDLQSKIAHHVNRPV